VGFGLVVVKQVVEVVVRAVGWCAEIEDSARVRGSWTRRLRLAARSLLRVLLDWGGNFCRRLGQGLATHSAEAVLARVLVSTISAAHRYLLS